MTNKDYTHAEKAFEKAEAAIQNASYNLSGGFFEPTANRAYYACFYCMIALLYTRSIITKTHSGTKNKFLELFVKPSIISVSVSDAINILFQTRQTADYDLESGVSQIQAQFLVEKAKEIYTVTYAYFKSLPVPAP